jgi:hypothetical protein
MGILSERRHVWRHHLDRIMWRRRRRRFRLILTLFLAAEGICLHLQGAFTRETLAIRLIRTEEICQTELIAAGGQEETAIPDIYGVRFCPDTLEIQFYHRKESINVN